MESALYYLYFKNHPQELKTLVRRKSYYVSKSDIVEHLKLHEEGYQDLALAIGLETTLNTWYKTVSAVTHCQNPSAGSPMPSISRHAHSAESLAAATSKYAEAADITRKLWLCTCAREQWRSYTPEEKAILLKNLGGDQKTALGLPQL